MITFSLNNIIAAGAANVSENGDTLQKCVIEVKINGIVSDNKHISEVVDFIVPNSVIVGSPTPIAAAWEYIKTTLAPDYINQTYAELV